MRDPSHWRGLLRIAAWIGALSAGAVAIYHARTQFDEKDRRDGNSGHASIDFGGQWLMGRMILEGQGRHLYHRPSQLAVLQAHYPHEDSWPTDPTGDARRILEWMVGGDGCTYPTPLRGPLYPPVQALFLAPLATLSPRPAYHLMQTLNLVLVFAIAWLVERLSSGRIWCPVASVVLMLFPGYAGVINLGQNSAWTLFLLTFGWWQMTRGRPVTGGVFWGMLAFKPVWAVSFFPVLLLSGRWRMALAMAATGLTLVLLTLPVVGLDVWFDWLAVGRMAARFYARDETWIILSRDLQGGVRRWFFPAPDAPLPSRLALGLWLAVAAATVGIALWKRRAVQADDGPAAMFVLLGAWLSCFHFMYYDTFVAALPVLLLFTRFGFDSREGHRLSPRPIKDVFSVGPREDIGTAEEARLQIPPYGITERISPGLSFVRSFPPILLSRLFIVPFVALVLLDSSHYIAAWLDPSYKFPPVDTYLLLLLWTWGGWCVLRSEGPGSSETDQFAELCSDVVGAHQGLADQQGAHSSRP